MLIVGIRSMRERRVMIACEVAIPSSIGGEVAVAEVTAVAKVGSMIAHSQERESELANHHRTTDDGRDEKNHMQHNQAPPKLQSQENSALIVMAPPNEVV
jgi:hypothetical protein